MKARQRAAAARRKLLALQQRIFRGLKAEADAVLGRLPESIAIYEREFQRDFAARTKLRPATREELVEAIRAADVSLIADFHTFHQAQRTALRLMRDAIREGERWAIGLEMIPSRFQAVLDSFQAGELDLEEFHARIRYREEWGFPWANYAPIFQWARNHGIRLIALNRPKELLWKRRTGSDLKDRDQWAAGVITDLFAASPRPLKLIVLYGEMHLASTHLPEQLARISRTFLRKPLRAVTVHQNHDGLYWKLMREGRSDWSVARIRKDVYCALSATPWAKLQSLVSWAEGESPDAGADAEPWDEDEGLETDHLSQMRVYGSSIAELLGAEPAPIESLTARTVSQADFVDELASRKLFNPRELRLIRQHVALNQRLYIPRAQIAYLGSPSLNGTAELAAIHLLRRHRGWGGIFEGTGDDFFRVATEAAFGFFGSLVLNPKRKCDLRADHASRLRALDRGDAPVHPLEREARKLALQGLDAERALIERGKASWVERVDSICAQASSQMTAMIAARGVGRVLGKRLHASLLSGGTDPDSIRALFLARRSSRFLEAYVEALRLVRSAPIAPSKEHAL